MAESQPNKCAAHCNDFSFFCSTCNKSACKNCEHVLYCYQQKHNVIPMKNAVDDFNKSAIEGIEMAKDITKKMESTFDFIFEDKANFESHLKLCRTAIEMQEKDIIQKVKEKTKVLISELEYLYKVQTEAIESQVNDLDSKQNQVTSLMVSINKIMNRPEETETLNSHKESLNSVKDKVVTTIERSFKSSIPNFIPSAHFNELINTESIGEIVTVNDMYKVDEDETITVTKEQTFVVKVSSPAEIDTSQLGATLITPLGEEETATEIKYQGSGEYRIKGSCNVEGDWQMKITAGDGQIKGSPVDVKVEKLGLVHTIDNIVDYVEHDEGTNKVVDVMLDSEGCILVSRASNYILKFNQSGVFVDMIHLPKDARVFFMDRLGDGHVVYSDFRAKCVVMCDDKFKEIRSFGGKGMMKSSYGVAVNEETRVLYVADFKGNCVVKFNIDDGTLLGKIVSTLSGSNSKLKSPQGVTLTKEGHLIVTDFGSSRIHMFDANDKYMRFLVGSGDKNGKVGAPCDVTIDYDDNIIVSSNHKLQLFDKNGVFIKRIDHKTDGLDAPGGIAIISNRPRRVAVANCNANNVKIINY